MTTGQDGLLAGRGGDEAGAVKLKKRTSQKLEQKIKVTRTRSVEVSTRSSKSGKVRWLKLLGEAKQNISENEGVRLHASCKQRPAPCSRMDRQKLTAIPTSCRDTSNVSTDMKKGDGELDSHRAHPHRRSRWSRHSSKPSLLISIRRWISFSLELVCTLES